MSRSTRLLPLRSSKSTRRRGAAAARPCLDRECVSQPPADVFLAWLYDGVLGCAPPNAPANASGAACHLLAAEVFPTHHRHRLCSVPIVTAVTAATSAAARHPSSPSPSSSSSLSSHCCRRCRLHGCDAHLSRLSRADRGEMMVESWARERTVSLRWTGPRHAGPPRLSLSRSLSRSRSSPSSPSSPSAALLGVSVTFLCMSLTRRRAQPPWLAGLWQTECMPCACVWSTCLSRAQGQAE